ncbi:hypothetical protein E5676_scaffold266G003150 [Cucumis melo var. makuwa]|uniref:Uncharacterized protein n=2 Tax=Cucumis melo TaxID=3656 RepID=A0A5D3DMK7_CUCMM|nr:uncharacterized protein LOC127151751 [Cucumis melo]KAA0039744.1 hypothetical protein E6C27_scaffold122G00040 [Cucumis melo var. makuwa]TYK24752.1 hypothetical protein E5676_scaffold266G003150 [Cucumis melo var. makuwa]
MWSFRVSVNDMKVLIDPLITLGLVDIMADGIFSPDMFCIMADSDVSIHSAFGIELLPPFFDTFYADEVRQLFWFRLTHLFPLAVQLLESGYTSFTFSIERFRYNHAQFRFEGPNGLLREVNFLLTPVVRPLSIGEIDLSAFVTMDSQEFSNIISEYHMFDYVQVIITNRRVSFSYAIIQETIITPQDGQCIIGGIRPPNEVQFIITMSQPDAFYHFASQSKRIWLFKEVNSTKGIITAPLGLHGRLVSFFCDSSA